MQKISRLRSILFDFCGDFLAKKTINGSNLHQHKEGWSWLLGRGVFDGNILTPNYGKYIVVRLTEWCSR